MSFSKTQELRYGENPHQQAAFYRDLNRYREPSNLRQLQGKELSYNNIADADAAWECVKTFERRLASSSSTPIPAGWRWPISARRVRQAFATDPTSAFGGIIAFNRDLETAEAVSQQFVEVMIAPGVTAKRQDARSKKNVRFFRSRCRRGRMLLTSNAWRRASGADSGSMNVQISDLRADEATTRGQQLRTLCLRGAWRNSSNPMRLYSAGVQTLGVGAGQMSRVDSARIASIKARTPD